MSELSIVIVNWNCGELLYRCVETVIESKPSITYEIIVVDNGSTDDSLKLLSNAEFASSLKRENRLRFIHNSENVGFGAANNQAFSVTQSSLLFLLNPDTEITPGAIDKLAAALRSSRRIGASGPKILNDDGSVQVSVWHNPPRAWQIVLSQLKLYLLLPKKFRGELLLGGHWAHDRRRTVPMLSGAAIMLRREVIDEVGGFDERFQMYAEDNEWCFRITQAGWQLLFEPAAVILHHGGKSSAKRWTNTEKIRIKSESWYLFERLSLPRWRLINNGWANLIVTSGQKFWRDIRGIETEELKLIRRLHWEHLKDSFKRKPESA